MKTRNRLWMFLCAAAWTMIAASFWGCSDGENPAGSDRLDDLNATVSFEGHTHTVTMEAGERDGERVLFIMLGGATHTHRIALTDRERSGLDAGTRIVLRRPSMGSGHVHTVTLN